MPLCSIINAVGSPFAGLLGTGEAPLLKDIAFKHLEVVCYIWLFVLNLLKDTLPILTRVKTPRASTFMLTGIFKDTDLQSTLSKKEH